MRFNFSPLALVLALASVSGAGTPDPRTTVQKIRSLPRAVAMQHRPVEFEGTVTYYRPQVHDLFVQDGGSGIFLQTLTSQNLAPGDRVQVKGTTDWGYVANIASNDIRVIGHRELPAPIETDYQQLIRGQVDSDLVTVRGVVHSADMASPVDGEKPMALLMILTDGGYIGAQIQNADPDELGGLLDAEVEITGVAGGRFDGKMEMTGIMLRVSDPKNIKVLNFAARNPWSIPVTQMDEILHVDRQKSVTGRVHVNGTVTDFEPGAAAVLQSGSRSLWVKTESLGPLRIGNWAEATGFPNVENGYLVLTGSEIQDSGIASPISPKELKWKDLASSKYIFDLVTIKGKVVMEARERNQDEYVLIADGQMFSAVYPHRSEITGLPPMRSIPAGSTVRVTGICVMDNANPFGHDVPFNVLIRSVQDIEVITPPSPLTVRNLTLLVVVLLLAVLGAVARALWAGRKMRRRVAELGYLSQRRGEILEDINRSRSLAEILERITELASMTLKGAPCWCRIVDGGCLGNCPDDLQSSGLRTVHVPIAGHSGHDLGSISSAFAARTRPRGDESKALTAAAELATLAIETSRLHSDLVHRSEFDMLTEIQNRFAFEKRLDELIIEAGETATMFGLVYIDLNDFKNVNDRYGHQAGDLYLQMVAERMRHQLRPHDMLARLGGDEFGVLVPMIRNRAEGEDITRRLEHCFSEPFSVKNYAVHGSASIGLAIYPTDSVTNDGLMSIADSAMYGNKRSKRTPAPKSAGSERRRSRAPALD